MNKKQIWYTLLLILLLGSILRIYGIGDESFWSDEFATVVSTNYSAGKIIKSIYSTTLHSPGFSTHGGTPPFYFVLANYWTDVVGLSEAKLRLLSTIFGVTSIFVLFLIGKLIFEYRVGLIAAFIFSINYLHILYSQEARSYNLLVLLTLLSVYFLLNALKKQSTSYWVAYVIITTLLIYTHYFAFFILLFEYFYLLFYWIIHKKLIKEIILSGTSIFLLYLIWIPAVLRQISYSKGALTLLLGNNILWNLSKIFVQFNSWLTPDIETRIALRSIYHSLADYSNINFFAVRLIGWLTIISVILLTILLTWSFFVSIFIKFSRKSKRFFKQININNLKEDRYLFLLMWFLVPILIPIILTLIFQQIPVFGFVQYTLFATPAYYLIVAKGILKLKKYMILLFLIALFSVLPLYSYYANFGKQQWRETADFLNHNREIDDPLLIVKGSYVALLEYYGANMENVNGVNNLDELLDLTRRKKSVWLVYSSERYYDPKGIIKGFLDENYELDNEKEFFGIKIFHYTNP